MLKNWMEITRAAEQQLPRSAREVYDYTEYESDDPDEECGGFAERARR